MSQETETCKSDARGNPFKVRLAGDCGAETTVMLRWIAERRRTGTRGHLTNLLYWHGPNDTA
jgi:hypothetical protein